ncbi:GNAT family N-acetyltransferase [Flavobacterium sp. JP2137]|uniref:GNAT family N-acetyltransferase n=1 Tax=Flavobacterium sp. JP2137 TaxID=3414510 RepID=UPI003D2FE814
MILQTERMVLRPWRDTDAESLFEFAQDERVGPIAGWPPHQSVEESAEVIKTVFAQPGVFAVTLKGQDKAIGLVGLLLGTASNFDIGRDEAEVSYWIGVPFWGRGLIPEAVREILRYGFDDLKLQAIWSGYFDNNTQSKHVLDKCGFTYQFTQESVQTFMENAKRTEQLCRITKGEWQQLQAE